MINSGVLFDTTEHLPQWSSLLDLIFELAKQKSWLREECGWILFEAVKILGGGSYRHQYVQQIIDKLHHYGLAKTSEGVAIWIAASERFAEVKFPQDTWHKNNPLHQREKQNLALILKEASPSINIKDSGDGPQAPQKGTWASKLHFAWAVILDHLPDFTSSTNETFKSPPGTTDLVTFWDECVDSTSARLCMMLTLKIFRKPFCCHCFRRAKVLGLFGFSNRIEQRFKALSLCSV